MIISLDGTEPPAQPGKNHTFLLVKIMLANSALIEPRSFINGAPKNSFIDQE